VSPHQLGDVDLAWVDDRWMKLGLAAFANNVLAQEGGDVDLGLNVDDLAAPSSFLGAAAFEAEAGGPPSRPWSQRERRSCSRISGGGLRRRRLGETLEICRSTLVP
jgi:hypothetical protein